MAGWDKDFHRRGLGRRRARMWATSRRSRSSTKAETVRENVMLGVADKKAKLDRFNEAGDELLRRDRRGDGQLQDEIDARTSGTSTARSTSRWRRCAARPTTRCRKPLGRRTPPRGALQAAARSARHAAARRADQPPRRRTIAWLQQHLIDYKGTILIVTHDRYFLDDITGWILELDRGRGIPYEGNYSSWLEQKAKRLEQEAREDKSKQKTLERELEWIRQGAKARQAKSEGPDQRL
jgi:hypothetical protein